MSGIVYSLGFRALDWHAYIVFTNILEAATLPSMLSSKHADI